MEVHRAPRLSRTAECSRSAFPDTHRSEVHFQTPAFPDTCISRHAPSVGSPAFPCISRRPRGLGVSRYPPSLGSPPKRWVFFLCSGFADEVSQPMRRCIARPVARGSDSAGPSTSRTTSLRASCRPSAPLSIRPPSGRPTSPVRAGRATWCHNALDQFPATRVRIARNRRMTAQPDHRRRPARVGIRGPGSTRVTGRVEGTYPGRRPAQSPFGRPCDPRSEKSRWTNTGFP